MRIKIFRDWRVETAGYSFDDAADLGLGLSRVNDNRVGKEGKRVRRRVWLTLLSLSTLLPFLAYACTLVDSTGVSPSFIRCRERYNGRQLIRWCMPESCFIEGIRV